MSPFIVGKSSATQFPIDSADYSSAPDSQGTPPPPISTPSGADGISGDKHPSKFLSQAPLLLPEASQGTTCLTSLSINNMIKVSKLH